MKKFCIIFIVGIFVITSLTCKGIFVKREPKRFGFDKIADTNQSTTKAEEKLSNNNDNTDNDNEEKSTQDIEKLVLATGKWPPYSSEDMEGYGIASRVITEVFRKIGIETEYKFYPWKRGELLIQEGNVFATFPYTRTEERLEKYLFTDEYIIYDKTVFFYYKEHHTKDDFKFEKIEDLTSYNIIGLSGYHYLEKFRKAGLYEKLDITDGEETAFDKLIAGRNDLLPISEAVGWEIIKADFPEEVDNFDTLDKPLVTSGFGLMVSKVYPDSEKLLNRFNKAFQTVIESGRYEKILSEYNLSLPEHLQKKTDYKKNLKDIGKVTMVTGEWPPFTSQDLEGKGFITEIITAVSNEIGIETEYKFYPWNRCELLVKEGKAFAAFPYSKNEKRQKIYDYSEPIIRTRDKFYFYKEYHKKDDFTYNKLEDLKPYNIAGMAGYYYIELFENAGMGDNLDYTDNELLAVKKLIAGRVDLVPLNELNAVQLINKHFPDEADNFNALDNPLTQNELHLIVSRTYPDAEKILVSFNDGLNRIKENGIYESILNKYGLSSKD